MTSTHDTPHRSLRARVVAASAATICVLAVLSSTSVAEAASNRTPAKAAHVRLYAATATSMTVTASPAQFATRYRVFVSTVKSDLYYDNLIHGRHTSARHYATASRPRVTVTGLKYTTAPYWYRVQTFNGKKFAYSADILSGGVRPSVPTALAVRDVGGLSLTWNSGPSTGFTVAQSTSPDMTASRRNYSIAGSTHQFTPYGITPGRKMYFAVRSVNNGVVSGFSAHASGTTSSHQQPIKMLTYNVLMTLADGTTELGGKVLPWSTRGPAVAALIKKANPDVMAIQEAGGWINKTTPGPGNPGVRQIDSLVSMLGDGYALAHTENDWAEMVQAHGYVRHYSYIVYKKSAFTAVGTGGFWTLGGSSLPNPHYAAYQELRSVQTGARYLFTSAHLIVGNTLALDKRRKAEATTLVTNASRLGASLGIKVIYAGDFNSSGNTKVHPLDGPGLVMRAARIVDSRLVAQRHTNNYASVNFLQRTPNPRPINVIDYVFAPAGIAVTSWALVMNLSKGKIVGTIGSDHNPVEVGLELPY